MSKKSSKTTARRSAQTGTFEIIHRAEQSWPLRILAGLVRLRAELALFTAVVVTWALLDTYVTPGLGAWAILGGLLLVVAAIPHTRRYAIRRFWSVYTRHRVRACLVNSRAMTHEGQVPGLLWSRPIPVGVRVWVLLRAGLAGRHIEHVTDEIAAACLAREARVHIHGIASRPSTSTTVPLANFGGFSIGTVTRNIAASSVSSPVSAMSWTVFNGRPVPLSVFCSPSGMRLGIHPRPTVSVPNDMSSSSFLMAVLLFSALCPHPGRVQHHYGPL